MSTPEALRTLVTQLTQELDQVQQVAQHGLGMTREKLLALPNNQELTQLFAVFNNVSFLAESYKGRIQETVRALSKADLEPEQLQDAGQDLAALLEVLLRN